MDTSTMHGMDRDVESRVNTMGSDTADASLAAIRCIRHRGDTSRRGMNVISLRLSGSTEV